MDKIKVYYATNLKKDDVCYTTTRFHKLVKRKIVSVEEEFKQTNIIIGEKLLKQINISGWIVLSEDTKINPLVEYEVDIYQNKYTFEDGTILPSYCVYSM